MKIGIVVSRFNHELTSEMLDEALAHCRKHGIAVAGITKVPGAFDMPLAIGKFLKSKKVDCVAVLGAVIKGETKHDEAIAFALAKTIHDLELKHGKPVGLGVMGPGITWAQAEKRTKDYAQRAVEAAVELAQL